jgi:hypothetical protein
MAEPKKKRPAPQPNEEIPPPTNAAIANSLLSDPGGSNSDLDYDPAANPPPEENPDAQPDMDLLHDPAALAGAPAPTVNYKTATPKDPPLATRPPAAGVPHYVRNTKTGERRDVSNLTAEEQRYWGTQMSGKDWVEDDQPPPEPSGTTPPANVSGRRPPKMTIDVRADEQDQPPPEPGPARENGKPVPALDGVLNAPPPTPQHDPIADADYERGLADHGYGHGGLMEQWLRQQQEEANRPETQRLSDLWRKAEETGLREGMGGGHYGIGEVLRDTVPGILAAFLDRKYNHGYGLGYIAAETAKSAGQHITADEAHRNAMREFALKAHTERTKNGMGGVGAARVMLNAQAQDRLLRQDQQENDPNSELANSIRQSAHDNFGVPLATFTGWSAKQMRNSPAFTAAIAHGTAEQRGKDAGTVAQGRKEGEYAAQDEHMPTEIQQIKDKVLAEVGARITAELAGQYDKGKTAETMARMAAYGGKIGEYTADTQIAEKRVIPGFAVDDMDVYKNVKPEKIEALRDAVGALMAARASLKTMQDIASRGWKMPWTRDYDTGAYETAKGSVMSALAKLEDRGVLQPGEAETIGNRIPSLKLSAVYENPFGTGKREDVLQGLSDQLEGYFDNRFGKNYGGHIMKRFEIDVNRPDDQPAPTRRAPRPNQSTRGKANIHDDEDVNSLKAPDAN